MKTIATYSLTALLALGACAPAPDEETTSVGEVEEVIAAFTQANAATDDKSVVAAGTGNWVYSGVTASYLATKLQENGARLTNLEVDPNDTSKFTATMVKNSGATAVSGWWWLHGATDAQVASTLSANSARLIDLQKYNTANGPRFTAVMVPNTGTNARSWWWYHDVSSAYLSDRLTANGARLTSLKSRTVNGATVFTAIMVKNVGADATGWWWYLNATPGYVASQLSANSARLIDYERRPNGNLDVVMVPKSGEYWFWYYDIGSISQAAFLLNQRASRAIELEKYYVNGSARYAVVMLDNANAATRKVERAFAPGIPNGAAGAFVRRVGSTTSVALQPDFVHDPASSLKVVHHLYSLKQHTAQLDTANGFAYWRNPADPTNKDVCPDVAWEIDANRVDTTLRDGLTRMMVNSDNRTTRGVVKRYGFPALNTFMNNIGMVKSELRQNIGCGYRNGLRNDTTVRELAGLYEGVSNGTLISGAARDQFWAITAGGAISSTGWLPDTIREEAASLGKSAAVATSFISSTINDSKGGSYDICGVNGCNVSYEYVRTAAGRMGLPIYVNGLLGRREVVYGRFISGLQIPCAPYNSNIETLAQAEARCPAYKAANSANTAAAKEAMRSEIRSALQTW